MKKLWSALIIITAMSFLTVPYVSQAQVGDKNAGIGVMIGEPTGLSYKNWSPNGNAFDVGVAWSFGPFDAISIHADYLWHNYNVFPKDDIEKGVLPFYYGVGGRIILAENDAVIGARIPVGLNYLFEDAPVGIFFEVAPIVNLVPDTDFNISGGIGVRYYF